MEKLVKLIKEFGDLDYLVAELEQCDKNIDTLDDLLEYLENELEYARE